jgi:hypothetical protein
MSEKRSLIEIIGGDSDGLLLDGASSNYIERSLMGTVLRMTGNGTVGHAFRGLSIDAYAAMRRGEFCDKVLEPAIDETNVYTVFDRLERYSEILVRMRHSVEPIEKG